MTATTAIMRASLDVRRVRRKRASLYSTQQGTSAFARLRAQQAFEVLTDGRPVPTVDHVLRRLSPDLAPLLL